MGLLSADEVGRRIRKARERLKLDQSELAGRLGGNASQGLISNWERGKATPNREYLLLLAGTLGIPVEDLVVDGDTSSAAAG